MVRGLLMCCLDERGQGLTEYALVIGFIAVFFVVALVAFRKEIGNVFSMASNALAQTSSAP